MERLLEMYFSKTIEATLDRSAPSGRATTLNRTVELKFFKGNVTTRQEKSCVLDNFHGAILLWMIGLAAAFGPGIMPLLLVLGLFWAS